jgi:hypothetical protein
MPALCTNRKRSLYRVERATLALIIGASGDHRPNVRGLVAAVLLSRHASVTMLGKCLAPKKKLRSYENEIQKEFDNFCHDLCVLCGYQNLQLQSFEMISKMSAS